MNADVITRRFRVEMTIVSDKKAMILFWLQWDRNMLSGLLNRYQGKAYRP